MRHPLASLAATTASVIAVSWPALAQHHARATEAQVMTSDGLEAGTVTFRQSEHGVVVTAQLQNVPEGPHGFHIHEKRSCDPDFQAAGGHYTPAGAEHEFDVPGGHHVGDLPNTHVDGDDTAMAEFFAPHFTLAADVEDQAPFTLNDADGSAVMVYERADDYESADSAGDRIACGIIASSDG